MQLFTFRKQTLFTITLALVASTITPSVDAFICRKTTKKIVGVTLAATAVACFFRLMTKDTKPYTLSHDASVAEQIKYFFDEILTGHKKKEKRASKVVLNEENPTQFDIVWEGRDASGVAGITHSLLKPVIIPALTLILIFNKEFKKQVIDGAKDLHKFIEDPITPFEQLYKALFYAEFPAEVTPVTKIEYANKDHVQLVKIVT